MLPIGSIVVVVACLFKKRRADTVEQEEHCIGMMMQPEQIFTEKVLADLFPPERSNEFFDALFGDADEGAYDIALRFAAYDRATQTLQFNLDLLERPGRCLVCNLTAGLPQVFSRHPIINLNGLVMDIERLLGDKVVCDQWQLGRTVQEEQSLHRIPLSIRLKNA